MLTALTNAHGPDGREGARPSSLAAITSYACACPDTTEPVAPNCDECFPCCGCGGWHRTCQARPAVVLDPFGGTGTTALLAHTLGRTGITADRSADYCRIAAWRTRDPGERARAMQVDKPAPVSVLQDALFEVTA
jgi:hypothetical protein